MEIYKAQSGGISCFMQHLRLSAWWPFWSWMAIPTSAAWSALLHERAMSLWLWHGLHDVHSGEWTTSCWHPQSSLGPNWHLLHICCTCEHYCYVNIESECSDSKSTIIILSALAWSLIATKLWQNHEITICHHINWHTTCWLFELPDVNWHYWKPHPFS